MTALNRLFRRRTVPGKPNKLASALLNLNFLSGVLDKRITFSRTTNATVTGSNGLVQYAPHNLLTYSEQFDNAVWLKSSATVTANAIAAPNGTATADLFVGTGVAANYIYVAYAATAGVAYYLSCYVKDNNLASTKQVWLRDFTEAGIARFNLSNGTVDSVTGIASDAKITDVGNGWYRISAKFSPTVSGNHNVSPVHIGLSASTASFYAWGAQLNIGDLQDYNPTTVKNLLGYTEHFDNAAWTKSNAFVQTNLLLQSNAFTTSPWSLGGTPVLTANAATAPDGTTAGWSLATNGNNIIQSVSVTSGMVYTFSLYVKQGNTSFIGGEIAGASTGMWSLNFSTLVVTVNNSISNGTATDAGNGWYRVSVRITAASTGTLTLFQYGSQNFGSSGTAFIYGAQLVQGTSAGDYKATYAAAAAVGYSDIYGQPFAQKLVEDTAAGEHRLRVTGITKAANSVMTYSAYVKPAGRLVQLSMEFTGIGLQTVFDVATGTYANFDSAGWTRTNTIITPVGDGWYRCAISGITDSGTSLNTRIQLAVNLANGINQTYTGDGASGIYIFGAQLSDSASVDPYVYNPVAAPVAQAYYGPRFDYDPVTLAPKGLLIEEQRTNLLLQSNTLAAYPTWSLVQVGVPSISTVASPDGSLNAWKLSELATTSAHQYIQNVTTTAQAYTFSFYAKAAERTWVIADLYDGTTDSRAWFNLSTGVAGTTTAGLASTITAVGNGWYRVTCTKTMPAATGSYAVIGIAPADNVSSYAGTAGSGVIVYGAQLEAGAFATSYIPTVASQVTRAADSASMIGNNFARWYNQSAGTLYAQFSIPANRSNMAIWQINESANARWGLNVITDNTFSYDFFTGSAGSQSGFVAGVSQKVSVAIKSGSTPSEAANGVVSTSVGSLAAFPSNTSTLYIGSRAADLKMSGTIARIAFYSRQLSPAEQQGITS